MTAALRHAERLFRDGALAGLGDDRLLARFLDHGDEEAFAAIVARHGPMVLATCLRVLRDEADAEDAFQATFLVLARRAASVAPREKVGDWLHGVAYKTAVKARAVSARRRARTRGSRGGAVNTNISRSPSRRQVSIRGQAQYSSS